MKTPHTFSNDPFSDAIISALKIDESAVDIQSISIIIEVGCLTRIVIQSTIRDAILPQTTISKYFLSATLAEKEEQC